MKKKFDAMTVISIVLILINLVIFFTGTLAGDCDCGEVVGNQFIGTVYAGNTLPQFNKISAWDGILRIISRAVNWNILFVVIVFDCISNNEMYYVEY